MPGIPGAAAYRSAPYGPAAVSGGCDDGHPPLCWPSSTPAPPPPLKNAAASSSRPAAAPYPPRIAPPYDAGSCRRSAARGRSYSWSRAGGGARSLARGGVWGRPMATSIAASFAWTARSNATVPGPPMGTEEEEGPPGPPLVEPPLGGPPPCRSDRYAERVSADAGSARTGSFIPGRGWVGVGVVWKCFSMSKCVALWRLRKSGLW